MEPFKIKLIPKVKDRDWEVKRISCSRKEKTCSVCGKKHPVGSQGITFTKRTSKGPKTDYDTRHTCPVLSYSRFETCAHVLAKNLNINLSEYGL